MARKKNPLKELRQLMDDAGVGPRDLNAEIERLGKTEIVSTGWVGAAYYSGKGKITPERATVLAQALTRLCKKAISAEQLLGESSEAGAPVPETDANAAIKSLLAKKRWDMARLVREVMGQDDPKLVSDLTDCLAEGTAIPEDFREIVEEKFGSGAKSEGRKNKKPRKRPTAKAAAVPSGLIVPEGVSVIGLPIEKLPDDRFAVILDPALVKEAVWAAYQSGQLK